jgi:hypothetical protein
MLCNNRQAVTTTWRMQTLEKWKQQQRHLILRSKTKYGNTAEKSVQLGLGNFLVDTK